MNRPRNFEHQRALLGKAHRAMAETSLEPGPVASICKRCLTKFIPGVFRPLAMTEGATHFQPRDISCRSSSAVSAVPAPSA